MKRNMCEMRVSESMIASVPVITPRTNVDSALRLVRDHDLAVLPVCDKGLFVGLVSEKDLLTLTPSEATSLSRFEMTYLLEKVTVGAVTKLPAATVGPDTPLCKAAAMMVKNSAETLPVLEHDRLAGFITWKEILAAANGSCG